MRGWLRSIRDAVVGGAARAPAVLRFEPEHPAFVADPYPTFAHLREHEPLHRGPGGAWVLTRHADVVAAFADERLGNAPARHAVVHARNRERYVCADVANNILPFLDRPEHTAPRRLIARAFGQQLKQSPPDVAGIAAALLDDIAARGGPFDVVADYGSPLAARVVADLLGVPRSDAMLLAEWSATFFRLFAPLPSEEIRERLDADLQRFRDRLLALLADRRAAPRADVLSALARDPGGLSDLQLVDNVMLLFADGIENVDRAIGASAHLLLEHPEQLRAWRRRPELLQGVVAECLRYESPAQLVPRIAREPVEWHGGTVPAGGVVLLALAAANRDPAVFRAPDRFDVSRSPNPHVSFGRGRHGCIGGPLVELELAEALRALFERFASLRRVAPVRWLPRTAHRWVDAVVVRAGRP